MTLSGLIILGALLYIAAVGGVADLNKLLSYAGL